VVDRLCWLRIRFKREKRKRPEKKKKKKKKDRLRKKAAEFAIKKENEDVILRRGAMPYALPEKKKTV
jgi:hypothetical protein